MRNARLLPGGDVLTVDNAACLGEKVDDVVQCPNAIVAYYTARVALLEQLCAGSMPHTVVLSNFTGDAAWDVYVRGISRAFIEMGIDMPALIGSTESNFSALQSALSIMMIGQKTLPVSTDVPYWFVAGRPLVGEALLANESQSVPLSWVFERLCSGEISYVHPVGSNGIQKELERLFSKDAAVDLPIHLSAGPATCVIVGSEKPSIEGFQWLERIHFLNENKNDYI